MCTCSLLKLLTFKKRERKKENTLWRERDRERDRERARFVAFLPNLSSSASIESRALGHLPLPKKTCWLPSHLPRGHRTPLFPLHTHSHTRTHARTHRPLPSTGFPSGLRSSAPRSSSPGMAPVSQPRGSFPSRPQSALLGCWPAPSPFPAGPSPGARLPAPRALRSRSRPLPAPGTALGATDQPCRCWEAGGGTQVLGSARTRTAALRGVSRRPRARGRGLWLQERRLPPPARPLRPEARLFPRPTAAHPRDPLGKGRTGPKSEVWAG